MAVLKRSTLTLVICLLSKSTFGIIVTPYADVVERYVCSNKITIVPSPTGKVNIEVYRSAQQFWQKYVPGITIQVRRRPSSSGINIFVKVGTEKFFSRDEDRRESYAEFIDKKPYYSKRFEGQCYAQGSIVLNNSSGAGQSFLNLSQELQKEYFAHEVGHALGLMHRDNNLMAIHGSFGLILDQDQIDALEDLYPAVH